LYSSSNGTELISSLSFAAELRLRDSKTLCIVGLHLGGAHTKKTAAVRASVSLRRLKSGLPPGPEHQLFKSAIEPWFPDLSCVALTTASIAHADSAPLLWEAAARDIGPLARTDSDTRLFQVLEDLGHADIMVIDAPLTLPPCTPCQQTDCQGINSCSQVCVKNMHEEWMQLRSLDERKVRTPQPYVDRYFEFFARNRFNHPALAGAHEFDSCLSSGRAPLTARAQFIAHKIRSKHPKTLVIETNSTVAALGWSLSSGHRPRRMENLRRELEQPEHRKTILTRFEHRHMALRSAGLHAMLYKEFAEHHETFLAAICALTGWGLVSGEIFVTTEFLQQHPTQPLTGWACLPKEITNHVWKH
jgi:hypothetical protein